MLRRSLAAVGTLALLAWASSALADDVNPVDAPTFTLELNGDGEVADTEPVHFHRYRYRYYYRPRYYRPSFYYRSYSYYRPYYYPRYYSFSYRYYRPYYRSYYPRYYSYSYYSPVYYGGFSYYGCSENEQTQVEATPLGELPNVPPVSTPKTQPQPQMQLVEPVPQPAPKKKADGLFVSFPPQEPQTPPANYPAYGEQQTEFAYPAYGEGATRSGFASDR